ncbi:MAG: UbiA prenyltransferase family protein [Deltaproteobacteria bacterium]|nr:UbiA prenyltransferase family protein [Deltaproteobacteria bacterium]
MKQSQPSILAEIVAIARLHIMLVAMGATVVFGWIATGERPWALTLVVTVDWFLINLMNRVTDIEEDLRNQIPGTERVARRKRAVTIGAIALMAGSFLVTHAIWPSLTPWRIAVQAIGVAYNYRIVPTPKGLSRFKEMYFFKNFGSSVLFVLTCFVYPIAAAGFRVIVPWQTVVVLAVFFVPFELTFEILYDMRDIEGDRVGGVPTYPVVHGIEPSRRIIDALLGGSAIVLAGAFLARAIGMRELLMIVAPVSQFFFYRPRYRRGLTPRDCVVLTHLGTAQLALFIVGTALWARAGLPANVFLGSP